MEFLSTIGDFSLQLLDIALHLDRYLDILLAQYGAWVYAILFLIIFCETGLVVTPFLPGDSLLFVTGALAATGGLDITLIIPLLIAAALIGDNVNYFVGRKLGPKVFGWEQSRLFNKRAFEKTHAFYERHGGKTIIIARFLPLVRTFAPFVAGIARMAYPRYFAFCIIGALVWVGSLTLAGYWFGNLPIVKNNLTLVILGIIALSLAPLAIGYLQHRLSERAGAAVKP
jgi:membrane-associated protein